ncbi:MAG: glycosyltransferase family 2 protein [Oscillochloris sp.]|nr:glycosyltransferase family 2 protein [Oscillochloris sp.]
MRLIVQIPALNESETIASVIADIPRQIPGVGSVEVLIVDDGCTDDTVAVALHAGANHVVRHTSNKGLATAYQTGIDTALRLGADIIVNTDADNQYPGSEIVRLVAPILEGQADIVIGDRQVQTIEHFSPLKRALQHVGSSVVRWASETDVPDTVSGFRALSRHAALRTFVTTDFSYTVENLIQAGKRRLTITAVPIRTNIVDRPSRLHRGNWNFIKRQSAIIARTYATYEPLKTFTYIAVALFSPGALLLLYAAYVFIGRRLNWFVESRSNDQSLFVGGVLVVMALVTFLIGLLADRVGGVRRVQEEILFRVRSMQVEDDAWRRDVSSRLDQIERDLRDETVVQSE